MPLFRLSGLNIASDDVSLDSYARASSGAADVTLQVAASSPPTFDLDHQVEIDGQHIIGFGRSGDGWVLRTDQLATFVIDHGACAVTCHPDPACPPRLLASMFVDRVIPHLVDARGDTAIHASAVFFEGHGAFGFLGDPGAGKSTLSAALCPPARYLCDDCAALDITDEGVWVHPSYAFSRLNPDVATHLGATNDIHASSNRAHKWRAQRQGEAERRQLRGLYILGRSRGTMTIEELGVRDAIVELARHLYRVAPTDRARLVGELATLEKLGRQVPVRVLRYPRRFDAVDEVRRAVLERAMPSSPRVTP